MRIQFEGLKGQGTVDVEALWEKGINFLNECWLRCDTCDVTDYHFQRVSHHQPLEVFKNELRFLLTKGFPFLEEQPLSQREDGFLLCQIQSVPGKAVLSKLNSLFWGLSHLYIGYKLQSVPMAQFSKLCLQNLPSLDFSLLGAVPPDPHLPC